LPVSSKRGKTLPQPLRLRRHLDASTLAELAEFLRFWGPHAKGKNGRARLVDELERLMSDENVIYAKVDLLSEEVRAVLMALLRKLHYRSDLQGLCRGIDGVELESYEAEAALTALARRGFVRAGRTKASRGRAAYAIPQEIALAMRGLAGTDRRPLSRVFVHEDYRPGAVESEDPAPLPDSVHDAIDGLEPPLDGIAREVVARYGGLLTRHEFVELFEPAGFKWNTAAFLQGFGGAGVGTVGHVDLRLRGIAVDDDALLFFTEAVDRYVEEWRERPLAHDVVLTAHGDLMSDVRTALAEIEDRGLKVGKEGSVYKSSRGRLAERLQFPTQPLLDRTEVTDRVLAVVRGLGLARTNGESTLAVTEQGVAWRELPLLDKVRDAYEFFGRDASARTLRARHLAGVRKHVIRLLTADEGWWPGASAGLLARNRYLLELEEADTTIEGAQLSLRHAALTELGRAAQELATRDLFALGLVDVALQGGEVAGVRLSRLGRRLLLDAPAVAPEKTRPLVVNPDFEVLVLPEGDVDELVHRLDRIAVRERTGEVLHYRLDRKRVERVTVDGETPGELLEFLETYARAQVPQNVAYSIRAWGGNVRSAEVSRGVLFETDDPEVVEVVRNHPALRDHVQSVVGPTAIFFDESVLEGPLAQELKALGIYVR